MKKLKECYSNKAIKMGVISWSSDIQDIEDLKEFIFWISIEKMSDKMRRYLNFQNEAIRCLSDILINYSHSKLNSIFRNNHISLLFSYYKQNWFQTMLDTIPDHKKKIYTKAADDLAFNFSQNRKYY